MYILMYNGFARTNFTEIFLVKCTNLHALRHCILAFIGVEMCSDICYN